MISAVVISFDDDCFIETCINQLQFVDEIIIIGTLQAESVSKFNSLNHIKFIQNETEPAKELYKIASKHCRGEWILGIGADVVLSNELSSKIVDICNNKTQHHLYFIQQEILFMGQSLTHIENQKLWTLIVWPNQKTKNLKKQKLKPNCFKSYPNFDAFNQRITNQCKREAEFLYQQKKRPNWFEMIFTPFVNFIKIYGTRWHFLKGKSAFIYAYLLAFASVKTNLFLWLKYRTLD